MTDKHFSGCNCLYCAKVRADNLRDGRRRCPRCGRTRSTSSFFKSKNTKSGLQTYCKQCQTEENAIYRTNHAERRQQIGGASRKKYLLTSAHKHCTGRAHRKGYPCSDKATFDAWHSAQERVCNYCGMTEQEAIAQFNKRLHIDRIDGPLGYVPNNMCLACPRCNLVKSSYLTGEQMKLVGDLLFKANTKETVAGIRTKLNNHYGLLGVAKRLLSYLDDDYRRDPNRNVARAYETNRQAIEQARSAIEKAEGGQS